MERFPAGHWTRTQWRDFKHLKIGEHYVVARQFTDYDGKVHAAGEAWRFLGHDFLAYDDGLSLFVSLDGSGEWQIRLQWVAEEQAAMIDDLGSYIRPV